LPSKPGNLYLANKQQNKEWLRLNNSLLKVFSSDE
jgi:hypothetical protein